MNSVRRRGSLKAVCFWLTVFVLLLLVAATSSLATRVHRIEGGQDLQIVQAPAGARDVGPELSRLPGRPVVEQARVALPYFRDLGQVGGLKRIRLRVDLDRYLARPAICCGAREGDPAGGASRSPGASLLISQALDGMDVYLNDVWIAGLPKSNDQVRYKWYRPLQAPLARRLLKPEGNVLTLELTTWDPQVQIAPVYVGDIDTISYIYELTYLVGSSLASASNVFCLLAGMFMLGAWLASRKDGAVFLHAGATTVLWSLLFWLILLQRVPSSLIELRLWAQYACTGGVVGVLTMFIFAFMDQPLGRRGRVVLIGAASFAALTYPWLGLRGREWLDAYWLPVLLLFHLYACSRLALHVARTRSRMAMSLLFQSVLAQVFALRDHNAALQLVSVQVPDAGWSLTHLLATPLFLSHLSVPLLLFVVAQILLTKFQANVKRIRDNNVILTETLRQRERELLVSYHRQRDMENEAAAQAERDRIYRDLHDGIGSKLVTTLFSVRDRDIDHARLEDRLLEALHDLREIISVTDVREQRSLHDVLFTYCSRLDEALSRAEFQVEYDIPEGPEFVLLDDLARQVMRIVEESVANTIKYARASRLSIRMGVGADEVLTLCIEDDGRPREAVATIVPSSTVAGEGGSLGGGSGLAGLRRRAGRIGGDFHFEHTAQGARTCLRLPLILVGHAIPTNESVADCSRENAHALPLS
jgi:signal transduction histidine kinase